MTSKTPITPEERAFMRANCERKLPHDMAKFGRPDPDDMRILRLLTALEAAEAESARLRAERGWLAENAADRPCAYDSCPFGLQRPTGPDDDDCDKTRAQCWQEAARRAVTAGEV